MVLIFFSRVKIWPGPCTQMPSKCTPLYSFAFSKNFL